MKKAFTMIELVFVIVVIGILAAIIIPSTRTNPVQEAAIDLVSKIRYTQHLAMVDDKYDRANANWFKENWQIEFDTGANTYSIKSGANLARDPSNASANVKNIDLQAKYGVTVALAGTECGTAQAANAGIFALSFDNFGRPASGDLNSTTSAYSGTDYRLVQTDDCIITLSDSTQAARIRVRPETGYATIEP